MVALAMFWIAILTAVFFGLTCISRMLASACESGMIFFGRVVIFLFVSIVTVIGSVFAYEIVELWIDNNIWMAILYTLLALGTIGLLLYFIFLFGAAILSIAYGVAAYVLIFLQGLFIRISDFFEMIFKKCLKVLRNQIEKC